MRRLVVAAVASITVAAAAPLATADDITPIKLTVKLAAVARIHRPLAISVGITADPSVLDTRTAPLRIRVKLASECGGEFQDTAGTVLLDKRLDPQPVYGQPYTALATGSGKPRSYGVETVCVYLEEEGDDRQFATDTSYQVDVSKPCSVAAARFDRARPAGRSSRMLRAARRRANRACGPGVPL